MKGRSAGFVRSGDRLRRGASLGLGTGNWRIFLRASLRTTRVRPWTNIMIALHTSSLAPRKLS